ncbi:MAG: glycosyltransferase family 2 protein [bacterium]
MTAPTGISLVAPLYRDASTVDGLVADAVASLTPLGIPFEIVLVDDASPDDAGERARAVAARVPNVQVLAFETNQGLGAALSAGILAARHSHVLYTDGDHEFELAPVAAFVRALDTADVVTGIRTPSQRPATRRCFTLLWAATMRLLFRLSVQDVNCSFKLFPRSILGGHPLSARHGFCDAEILLLARDRGLTVVEIPVVRRPATGRPSNFLRARLIAATLGEALRAKRGGLGGSRRPSPRQSAA